MTIKTLYKYRRPDGGINVSPIIPPEGTPYTLMYRLIADGGMVLTKDGENFFPCVDVEDPTGWYEVPEPPEPEEEV